MQARNGLGEEIARGALVAYWLREQDEGTPVPARFDIGVEDDILHAATLELQRRDPHPDEADDPVGCYRRSEVVILDALETLMWDDGAGFRSPTAGDACRRLG